MAGPVVEISGGSHQVCMTKNATDTKVISVRTTAKTLPISPRLEELRFATPTAISAAPTGRGDAQPILHHRLVRKRFEREIDLRVACAHGYILSLRAVLLLPGRDGVLPRGKAFEAKRTILSRYRVVR